MNNDKMDFKVHANMKSETLVAEIVITHKGEEDLFFFYLLLDGVVIDKSGWLKSNTNKWILTKRGNYTVQGHLKRDGLNEHKFSIPKFYSSSEDEGVFSTFLEQDFDVTAFDIDFYCKEYPYKDFSLVVGDNKNESSFFDLNQSESFFCEKISHLENKTITMITEKELVDKQYFFSGSAKSDDRLIFGDKDIECKSDLDGIMGSIGNYSMVNFNDDSISIKTDYFGISKLYYYSYGSLFVVSNSYHMLLIILKYLNCDLTINKSKALANLSVVNLQPFYQNFSREMEVNDILCMEPSQYIIINDNGVSFEKSGIAESFNISEGVSPEDYSNSLFEAKNEIIDNVNVALKHKSFNNLILDLSGGLDARMVYSALTNLPGANDKVKINSLDQPQEPGDIKPALAVNNCYKFDFDDLAAVSTPLLPKQIINNIYSHYLGTYYSYRLPQSRKKIDSTIRLSGMYGEIMARPYYSRAYLNTEIDAGSIDELVDLYVERYRGGAILGADENAMQAVKDVLIKELSLLPGKSPIEKFDLHYLFYRGSLHCNDAWRTDITIPEWGPLQSKKLFKLKMKTFNSFKSIKLQLDMMNVLNPILAAIKYGDASYNNEKELLKDKLHFSSPVFKDVSITENYDNTQWAEANELKEERRSTQISSEKFYKEWKGAHAEIDLSNVSLNALGYIYKKEALEYDAVMKIFFWISANKGSQRLEYLSNKLVSLAIQLRLAS
jgi:hypothetical protein